MTNFLFWRRIRPDSPITLRLPNTDDAGYDLCTDETLDILPDRWYDVPTGIAVEIPLGHVGLIWSRSGLTFRQHFVTWGAGVIDASYRGEIRLSMTSMDQEFKLNRGDRVAQMIIVPYITPTPYQQDVLSETQRGSNGFGSTGR